MRLAFALENSVASRSLVWRLFRQAERRVKERTRRRSTQRSQGTQRSLTQNLCDRGASLCRGFRPGETLWGSAPWCLPFVPTRGTHRVKERTQRRSTQRSRRSQRSFNPKTPRCFGPVPSSSALAAISVFSVRSGLKENSAISAISVFAVRLCALSLLTLRSALRTSPGTRRAPPAAAESRSPSGMRRR